MESVWCSVQDHTWLGQGMGKIAKRDMQRHVTWYEG